MAKITKRLTDLTVRKGIEPGSYPDGEGLYLQIRESGAKDWFYRYQVDGKGKKKGLGSYPTISLEAARDAALECRILRKNGIDPINHFKKLEAEQRLEDKKSVTFKECAKAYIEAHQSSWKNEKHRYQWNQSLESYVFPTIGELSVQNVDLGLVLNILEPIWNLKTETASRIRQRIEVILDWARVRQYREGENPARWRGHLDKLLPSPKKIQKVKHQPAMDYRDLPAFYLELRKGKSVSKLALALVIQSGVRSKEARLAEWSEFDLVDNVWTIPEHRMKTKEHRVPLTKEMLAILKDAEPFKQDKFVFPSTIKGQGVSDTSVRNQLKKTYPKLTVHGFRSTLRDWCAEMTNYSRELAEKALGHVLTDRVEAAYQRGDMFEKRRKLMDSWSEYCLSSRRVGDKAEIIPINKNSY